MDNIIYIIIGLSLPFLATVLGSSFVFIFKKEITPRLNSIFLGFAAGIMIAASIWSLIIPSLDYAKDNGWGNFYVIPVIAGFFLGALTLYGIDKLVPHLHVSSNTEEGIKKTKLNRNMKMFLAMTIHNFPEGIAVGFALAVANNTGTISMLAALGLAIGIAIQNVPEGIAVSLPMANETTKKRAFGYGVLSAVVEPIGAILAFAFASFFSYLLPWLLAFAAGAMLYVVVEELIPEAKLTNEDESGTFAILIGFILMMVLDVLLG